MTGSRPISLSSTPPEYMVLGSTTGSLALEAGTTNTGPISGSPVSPPGADYTKPNTYGFLWVPAAATTQGYAKFYFNGVQVGNTITWNQYNPSAGPAPSISNGTAFSVLDKLHLALILGTGSSGTPNTVYSVSVWQNSSAGDISTLPLPDPTPANVTTGTGPDSLVLKISEHAYANGDGSSDAAGDATFTVAIDGKQQGGTFTAGASHAAGADQTFSFDGYFGPGSHTVTVTFLNDAWGGTASTDRNLFVDGVTYEGSNTNQSAALYSDGSQTFAISGGTAKPTVSPSGTTIKSSSAAPIIDQNGNAWSLVQSASNGLQIAVNGTVDAPTANVVLLKPSTAQWSRRTPAATGPPRRRRNDSWTQIANPNPTPSSNGTKITSASASPIIDKSGNAWTLVQSTSKGLQIAVNGTVDDPQPTSCCLRPSTVRWFRRTPAATGTSRRRQTTHGRRLRTPIPRQSSPPLRPRRAAGT